MQTCFGFANIPKLHQNANDISLPFQSFKGKKYSYLALQMFYKCHTKRIDSSVNNEIDYNHINTQFFGNSEPLIRLKSNKILRTKQIDPQISIEKNHLF